MQFSFKNGIIPKPRRTILVVLCLDEDISGKGAITYYNELPNHVLAMESDFGIFITTGFGFIVI